MAGVESEVLEAFLAQLENATGIPAALAERLGSLLSQEKLPKVDELVELFAVSSGDPLA